MPARFIEVPGDQGDCWATHTVNSFWVLVFLSGFSLHWPAALVIVAKDRKAAAHR
jgi:hypothetical protein